MSAVAPTPEIALVSKNFFWRVRRQEVIFISVIVDAKTLGTALGVSERTVRRLVNEGVIDKVSNGQYDIVDCCRRYIDHVQEKIKLMDKDEKKLETSLMAEKVMHERAKKRKTELVVAEMERSMHLAADIERLWNWTIAAFKSRIRALPSKIAPQVQFTTDISEINDILRREIDESLVELSEYDPEKFYKGFGGIDSEEDGE